MVQEALSSSLLKIGKKMGIIGIVWSKVQFIHSPCCGVVFEEWSVWRAEVAVLPLLPLLGCCWWWPAAGVATEEFEELEASQFTTPCFSMSTRSTKSPHWKKWFAIIYNVSIFHTSFKTPKWPQTKWYTRKDTIFWNSFWYPFTWCGPFCCEW